MKIFISYTDKNDIDHKNWVNHLATDLKKNGIDIILDQWNLDSGNNLGVFMEKSITESDYIILVCTPSFAEKVNNRDGGVGYEADLIVGQILTQPNKKEKFIPILKSGSPAQSIPTFLQSRLFADFTKDLNYKNDLGNLLNRILYAPVYKIPENVKEFQPTDKRKFEENKTSVPRANILVAGLGLKEKLTAEIIEISNQIGKKLSDNNFGLVTGGWPGVDEIVARAFSNELLELGKPLENYLTQVIDKKYIPVYSGGNLVLVNKGNDEYKVPVEKSNAIILVNGVGGTYETGNYGLIYKKPVFPLAETGGDATKFYLKILNNFEDFDYKNITKNEFQGLGNPIKFSVNSLFDLLNKYFDE